MPKLKLVVIILIALCGSSAVYAKTTKLSQIFNPEMIGANIAYFERATGPAKNTYSDINTYKIGGCNVDATIYNGTIQSLRLEVSSKCTVDLNQFFSHSYGKFSPAYQLTFGNFDMNTGNIGQYYASCLTECGNAADPVIFEKWLGSRADQFIEVQLEVVLAKDAALTAAGLWHDVMEKVEGKNWVMNAKFNCTSKYNAVARKAFRNVKISGITIGRDIIPPNCQE